MIHNKKKTYTTKNLGTDNKMKEIKQILKPFPIFIKFEQNPSKISLSIKLSLFFLNFDDLIKKKSRQIYVKRN